MARTSPPEQPQPATTGQATADTDDLLDRLLDYKQVRKLLGNVSQTTVETLVRTQRLRSVPIGRPGSQKPRRMFRRSDVEAYIKAQTDGLAS